MKPARESGRAWVDLEPSIHAKVCEWNSYFTGTSELMTCETADITVCDVSIQ
jgi:hypothetical protein